MLLARGCYKEILRSNGKYGFVTSKVITIIERRDVRDVGMLESAVNFFFI